MPNISTLAFVLKKNNFKESDKIIVFLTEKFGKITALGKFAKKSIKRNMNLLDFGYLLTVYLKQNKSNDIYFIEKIEFVEKIIKHEDYKLFYLNLYINELLTNVIYGQEENKKIFYIVKDFFTKITSQNFKKSLSTLILFRFKLLEALGYKVKTNLCIICGNSKNITQYSLEKKGFICNNCLSKNDISICEGTKKVISQIDKVDYVNINFSDTIFNELEIIFNETLKNIVTIHAFNKLAQHYSILKNGI